MFKQSPFLGTPLVPLQICERSPSTWPSWRWPSPTSTSSRTTTGASSVRPRRSDAACPKTSCHTGVCEQKHSFGASLRLAIQQQKLLSSPWCGVFEKYSHIPSSPDECFFHWHWYWSLQAQATSHVQQHGDSSVRRIWDLDISGPREPCWQKPCWQIYSHGLHGYVGASAGFAPLRKYH